MTVQEFRRLALEMDGAIERSHLNHPDFRAGGKIFATIHLAERQGMVKLTPEQQERVIREYPGAFHPASGMEGRQGCRSEEHTSELQSRLHLVCRLLLEKKKKEN